MKILKMFSIFNFSIADIKRCFRVCPLFKSFYLHTSLPAYIKKSLCIIVMITLLFSGVLPKNQGIKNNIVTAINCAINNIQVNFCDKYLTVVQCSIKYVASVSNIKILKEVQLVKEEQKEATNNKAVPPVNTSADNAIILQNNIKVQSDNILKTKLTYLVYRTTNKLYNCYDMVKITNEQTTANIGILFFILFSILVVRIKDTIAVINNNKITRRNRLGYV